MANIESLERRIEELIGRIADLTRRTADLECRHAEPAAPPIVLAYAAAGNIIIRSIHTQGVGPRVDDSNESAPG